MPLPLREARLLANRGLAIPQYELGMRYRNGDGVPRSAAQGAKWLGRSAAQGYPEAQLEYGCCFYYGAGVARDYTTAVKWFRKSADQGCAGAQ